MNTQTSPGASDLDAWLALPLEAWQDTYETLHMWLQIVGKVRTALSPPVNHWWHSTLYVTARGLTTSPIPYGTRTFEISFDFLDHNLLIQTSDGGRKALGLFPRSVAAFYHELMGALRALDLDVTINPLPQEVPNPIRYDEDHEHASYDAQYAQRCWRVLVQADRVFKWTLQPSIMSSADTTAPTWHRYAMGSSARCRSPAWSATLAPGCKPWRPNGCWWGSRTPPSWSRWS